MTTEELRKSLLAEKKNGYTRINAEQKEEMNTYCKRYAAFMDASKTEREATAWAVAEAEKYDVILQEAVYINPKHDITDKVIKALNASAGK